MKRSILVALFATLVLIGLLSHSIAVAAGSNGSGPGKGGKGARPTATPTSLPVAASTSTAVRTVTPPATATSIPPATATATATATASASQREQETVDLINQRRVAMGLAALRLDPALTTAAREQSYDMGPLHLCQHTGTNGSTPSDRVYGAGYPGNFQGEVIGCGYLTSPSVVDAWWASSPHYSILTQTTANDIGCGWWVDPNGYGWVTCDLGWAPR